MTKLIPTRQAATRYGVTIRSIDRWAADPAVGSPTPVKINTWNYFDAAELDEFDRRRVQARHAETEAA